MRYMTVVVAFLILLCAFSMGAIATAGPTVPGFSVEIYAVVPNPDQLTFAPSGDLFAGNQNFPSQADASIHRVGPGGTPVLGYGPPRADPDAVLFDEVGVISGTPGSVLVGGDRAWGAGEGLISAVLPDETAVHVFGPTTTFRNPISMEFDTGGRLVFTDAALFVFVSEGAAPAPLFYSGNTWSSLAIDSLDQIYTTDQNNTRIQIHDATGALVDDSFAVLGSAVVEMAFPPSDSAWGNELYTVTASGELYRIDGSGTAILMGEGFDQPADLEFGPHGAMYVSSVRTDTVYRVGACSPHSSGYWHRQCLGAGLITPGRSGRGPQTVLEPGFEKHLLPAVSALLEENVFTFFPCEDGMDADPPSDKCERALKQYTSLLFNQVSGRLGNGCRLDLSAEGCTSTTVGELVDELAGLINSEDAGNCRLAADCAAAVNVGNALVEGLPTSSAVGVRPLPVAAISTGAPIAVNEPVVEPVPARDSSGTAMFVPGWTVEVGEPEADAVPDLAADEDPLAAIQRHLGVVAAQASSPARARSVSTEALLTALSGGYEPEVRIQIVRVLLGKVEIAYESLLAEHLWGIRDEAEDSGKEDLAKDAERLLRRLAPSED